MNLIRVLKLSSKCWSFLLQFLVLFPLMVSANSNDNGGLKRLGEEVRKYFERQTSCVSDQIDARRCFSWNVRENESCDDDLSTDTQLGECFANFTRVHSLTSLHCLIELASVLKNTSASDFMTCQKPKIIKLVVRLPTSCRLNDFEEGVLNLVRLQSTDKECLWVKTDSSVCYKIGEEASVNLYVYISLFLLTFVIVSMICTVYDLLYNIEKDSDGSSLLKLTKDFSIVRNFYKLMDTSLPNEKPCIHFISICTIILVVVGQQQIFSASPSGFHVYQMSSSRCVDVLFVVSGFLTFYYGFEPMQKEGGLFLAISVVFRWLRMMPTYCVLTLFVMYVLPNLDGGITWKYRMQSEASVCESKFWSNFFCVADYSDLSKECFSISWYIRLDLQLSAIGGILLLIFTKEIRVGLTTLSLVVVGTYILAAIYSVRQVEDAIQFFQSSMYSRIPPYFIGFIIGIILTTRKGRNSKFSNVTKFCILTAAFSLKIIIAFCDWLIPIDRTSQWTALIVVTYAASSRWIYVLFETSVILIYYTSGSDLLNRIIQLKMIIPVGRLSYVALLTSAIIQLIHSGNSGNRNKLCSHSVPNLITWILIDILYAYFVGFLIHLFFEAPFSRISKRILKYLLWAFAKPMEEVCRINSKDEPDKYTETVVDWKLNKNLSNDGDGPNTSIYENAAFENDSEIVKKL